MQFGMFMQVAKVGREKQTVGFALALGLGASYSCLQAMTHSKNRCSRSGVRVAVALPLRQLHGAE